MKPSVFVLALAVGVLAAAPLAQARDARVKKLATQERLAMIVAQARFDFERSHAELGLVGSAAALEAAADKQRPSQPSYGLITGLPLGLPSVFATTTASFETPLPAPAR
jgi:hypothetical protein